MRSTPAVLAVLAVLAAGCGSLTSEPGREWPRLSLVDAGGTLVFERELIGAGIVDPIARLDADGLTIAGKFLERLDLGGGELRAMYNELEGQYGDMFVARLDRTGREVWHRHIVTTRHAWPQYVLADAAGRVVVIGGFFGEIELEGARMEAGATDAFAIAFDVDGATAWAHQIGDVPNVSARPADQTVTGAAMLPNGELALTGTFQYSATFGQMSLTRADEGVFLAALSGNGTPVQTSQDLPWSSIELHAASATSLLVVHDKFNLASVDPNDGRVIWDREYELAVTDAEYALDGSIAIAGHDGGWGEGRVAMLDAAGGPRWQRQVASDLEDGSTSECRSVLPLADGGVQVAGAFKGVAVFDKIRLLAPQRSDFLARLGPSGEVGTAVAAEQAADILAHADGSWAMLTWLTP